jgi:hypothetical protein
LVCSQCGEHAEVEDVIEEALGRSFEWVAHEAMKEGLESPLETCPECDRETFITDELRCANCGFSLEGYKCAICSVPLSVDDYRNGDGCLCSYHHHVMSTESAILPLGSVKHRYMRGDRRVLDQPGQHRCCAIGAIASQPFGLKAKAVCHAIDHGAGRSDLGLFVPKTEITAIWNSSSSRNLVGLSLA